MVPPLGCRQAVQDLAHVRAVSIHPPARSYPAAAALRAVLVWSRPHGLVSLEIAGNFASMGTGPDQVFEAQPGSLTA